MASRNLVTVGIRAKNDLSKELTKVKGDLKATGDGGVAAGAKLGAGFSAGLAVFGAVTTAVQGVVTAAFDTVNAASEMNETITKTEAVFGSSAKEIKDWSTTAAAAMGISSQQAMASAASFGNLFKSMGVGADQMVPMSEGLVQLASDLASFNNQDPTAVLQSLQSGLVGEVEAVRKFGIALSATTVENKIFEMGLAKSKKEITEGMKVQARYAVIMEQTKTAQGDFARTADGLANSQRTLNAMMADMSVKVGDALLPVMAWLAQVVARDVLPAISALVDMVGPILGKYFTQLFEVAKKVLTPLAFLNDVLKPMGGIVGFLGKAFEWWLGVITSAVDILMGLLGVVGDLLSPLAAVADFLGEVVSGFIETETAADGAKYALDEFGQLTERSSEEVAAATSFMAGAVKDDLFEMREHTSRSGGALGKLGAAAQEAAEYTRVSTGQMTESSRKLRSAFVADALAIIADYYDPIELRQEQVALTKERTDLEMVLSSKKSSEEEIALAKKRLSEIERAQTELVVKLGATGDATAKETRSAVNDWTKKWKTATKEQRKDIDKVIQSLMRVRLAALQASRAYNPVGLSSSSGGNRASGGPVSPWRVYTVGEAGPETLVMSGSGGYVIPNTLNRDNVLSSGTLPGGSGRGGGGMVPVTIPVQLDGREIARVADRHLYYDLRNAGTSGRR